MLKSSKIKYPEKYFTIFNENTDKLYTFFDRNFCIKGNKL